MKNPAQNSVEINKVLPAVMKTSKFLREKYCRPVYGATNGIPSKNYKDFVWWRSENGVVVAPYDLLKDASKRMLGEDVDDDEVDDVEIAEGGAAAAAFSRLQYERLDEITRREIKDALLRYCELDTLAMVMIVEAWRAELQR